MMHRQIKDAFDGVHAEETLKRRTGAYLAEQIRRRPGRAAAHRRQLAVSMACFAVVLLAGCGFYFTPVSAISVDVNPSVELHINRLDRVVSVDGYNEDGAALAASPKLRHLRYAEALDVLLSSDDMKPYLEGDALVSITVAGSDAEKGQEMLRRISSCAFAASPGVECCLASGTETAAHEAGLSLGKYQAFLELQALDPNVTPEEVQGLSMRQIRDKIAALSGTSEAAPHGSGEGGNQPGAAPEKHGNGKGADLTANARGLPQRQSK